MKITIIKHHEPSEKPSLIIINHYCYGIVLATLFKLSRPGHQPWKWTKSLWKEPSHRSDSVICTWWVTGYFFHFEWVE